MKKKVGDVAMEAGRLLKMVKGRKAGEGRRI